MSRARWLGMIVLAGLAGCQNPFLGRECSTIAIPALRVTVVDSLTGENLAPEATVRVRDGAFVDSLRTWFGTGSMYQGPLERAGVYEVVATHPAYLEWRQTGVRVRDDGCHPITRELTARLVSRP